MPKVLPLLLCLLLATSSCTSQEPAGYRDAQQKFNANRDTFEVLLSKLTACSFRFNERGRQETYAIIPSDPHKSFEYGACSGDEARTTEIAVLLRKVGASFVEWDLTAGTKQTNVEFVIEDQYAPDKKTRTRKAIAFSVPAIANPTDDSNANAPACVEKVRALTSAPPYNWLWVYRRYNVDDPNRKWCLDLRVP
jgi:hypothetical protein